MKKQNHKPDDRKVVDETSPSGSPSGELKTLKDLEFWNVRSLSKIRMMDELKAEAVKWVKNHCGSGEDNYYCLSCRRFIKFFNLTEENLK